MNTAKTLIQSWTFWFGVAQIVYAGAGFLSGNLDQNTAITLAITGFGSIGLRLKTSQPISGMVS